MPSEPVAPALDPARSADAPSALVEGRFVGEIPPRSAPIGEARRPVIRVLDADTAAEHLQRALQRAEEANPGLTATGRLSGRARLGLVAALVALTAAAVIWPAPVLGGLTTLCTVVYLVTLANRVHLVRVALGDDPSVTVTDAEARAVPDADLPLYTVLVPAYGEPAVVPGLLDALGRIEYPRDRLEVKLLLEADDLPTIRAAMEATTDLAVEVLLVPPGEPRTKPRALNFGMEFARGELVTIYDAEDHPDPLQLRRAVVAFERVGDRYACLQARLSFYGGHRNLLTRWFTNDYFTWFRLYLPGLSATGAPIPLGGTSNHFRRDRLEEVGCWDPWNVTEDADLGIRLQRRGYRVGVLDSVTMEEPNIDVVNWVKQRSRWYKGYLQTFLVAVRRPRELVADLGWRDTARLGLFVGGTPVLAVLNLWFWSMTLFWFLTRADVIDALFPGWTYYMAVGAWAVGNLTILYIGLISLRVAGRPEYLLSGLLVPLYWLLMSVAALRAAIQLVTDPSHWEKTEHGLLDPEATPELRRDT
jgi:cellulose synthase/poly-beta-1,6-N-acetylglucosamine synthase-like glycosyltransferase